MKHARFRSRFRLCFQKWNQMILTNGFNINGFNDVSIMHRLPSPPPSSSVLNTPIHFHPIQRSFSDSNDKFDSILVSKELKHYTWTNNYISGRSFFPILKLIDNWNQEKKKKTIFDIKNKIAGKFSWLFFTFPKNFPFRIDSISYRYR